MREGSESSQTQASIGNKILSPMPLLSTLRTQSPPALATGLNRAWAYSLALHVLVIAASLVVLPRLSDPLDSIPPPVIVDVVDSSDITNLPPPPKSTAAPKTITREVLPELKPEPTPEPEPIFAIKPPETPKAKPEPKPDEKPKPTADDFDAVLKTVEKFQPKAPDNPDPAPTTPVDTKSYAPGQGFIPSLPVSISDIDALRQQIGKCWNLPAGARNPEDLIVAVTVVMNPDGTVQQAQIDDTLGRANSDPFYRAAAEAALRAVMNPRCQPFKLPPEKFHQWQRMTINFDPRAMLGL